MPRRSSNDRSNKFCDLSDLSNEASVEQFFVSRLLEDLGYADRQIKPKTSLSTLAVNLGRRRVNYKPDYALDVRRKIRWIVDAKAVDEDLDAWIGQCSSYCLNLNRAYNDNPCTYFLLSNGATTKLFLWDREDPILELDFADFVDGNGKFERLREYLSPSAVSSRRATTSPALTHTFRRKSVSDLNVDFAWCHRTIHRRENIDYSAAFMEFVKLIFLKLLSDREVHAKHGDLWASGDDTVEVPIHDVVFSTRWIEDREDDYPNPINALQFRKLVEDLEDMIRAREKKRIFRQDEQLQLSPETIKALTERLQNTDLYSLDADLNGRLFETFLSATLRGKDLGQFFTPRSVVKLATRVARLEATPQHVDVVLDACCGTGGFLIEALADMWSKANHNRSLSAQDRAELRRRIAEESIYGIDVAKEPALARIARINMFLHGDGGSSIFQTEALDKSWSEVQGDPPEIRGERLELKNLVGDGDFADVILTNPPFAKEYKREQQSDRRLLDEYDLAFDRSGGQRRARAKVRSSVMFLERYYDLLKPGGRMVTVIDDGILGSESYAEVREWLREHFLIRAVISLPGDAFQRSRARVKTSVLVVEKKRDLADTQPDAFMYYCTAVGIDDAPRQRVLPIDEVNRRKADEEIETVAKLYDSFVNGRSEAKKWTVSAAALTDRIDVKACLPKPSRRLSTWKRNGFEVVTVGDILEPRYGSEASEEPDEDDVIVTSESDDLLTYIRVRYDGFCEFGDEIYASESTYARLYRIHENDLVVSHINAVHGAVGVVPKALESAVATNEYTVCRSKGDVDVRLIWALIRSTEARADLLLLSTGIGRSRVQWDDLAKLRIALPPDDLAEEVVESVLEAEALEEEARQLRQKFRGDLDDALGLNTKIARTILAAFKPPR